MIDLFADAQISLLDNEQEDSVQIEVRRLSEKEIEQMGIRKWPVWEKRKSIFEWYYDMQETCFFLDGEVEIETKDGRRLAVGKGDYVVFPKGLTCRWNVLKDVRKHYSFGC